jgi:hypothetical protein
MDYEEAASCYFNSVSNAETLPQPSECSSVMHDDGMWCLCNVNGLLALVDEAGCVLRYQRDE